MFAAIEGNLSEGHKHKKSKGKKLSWKRARLSPKHSLEALASSLMSVPAINPDVGGFYIQFHCSYVFFRLLLQLLGREEVLDFFAKVDCDEFATVIRILV